MTLGPVRVIGAGVVGMLCVEEVLLMRRTLFFIFLQLL